MDECNVEEELQDVENHNNSNIILAITWKYGKVFGSYYNLSQKQLYTIMEIIDRPPHFNLTQSFLRELSPKHVITLGKLLDPFVGALMNILNNNDYDPTVNVNWRKVPSNLTLLDGKDYSYAGCKYRVENLRVQSQPKELQNSERFRYIGTLVNLESVITVHVLGALIKFLEQTWRSFKTSDGDDLIFMDIKQETLNDHVCIDSTTFKALNVFNETKHDSTFKYGGSASSREGVSLFKLLSQHCKSKMTLNKLREIMKSPINNVDELNKRYDFMDFIIDPRQSTLVASLNECIHKVTNVDRILLKLRYSQCNARQWKFLYNTIFALLQIKENIKPYKSNCRIFQEYCDLITDQLYIVESCIESSMVLENCQWGDRPWLKEGLDEDLDEAMAKYTTIKNRLLAAAKTVVKHLPSSLEECTMRYIPDMGHVISVRKWAPNCHPHELLVFGCYYLFELNDDFHYKNALCRELDNQLGDLPMEIENHQNRIIQRIARFVVNDSQCIINPLQYVVYMDSLMSMAKVGSDRNYIRPKFIDDNTIDIQNGRHPLMEISNPNFVPNDFASGRSKSLMKIITGPNSSGKSIYLKQTMLLVYMAHIGSYLPASRANIGPIHSIHSRLHSMESAALNMSAFYIDLFQMGIALYNAKHSSLVVMDEFGRGTTGMASTALILGALRKFLSNEKLCPHVIISTHMTLERKYLDHPLVLYQKMSHVRNSENSSVTFLYKIVEGESTSCTFETLEGIFDDELINRAKEIYNSLADANTIDVRYFRNINMANFDD